MKKNSQQSEEKRINDMLRAQMGLPKGIEIKGTNRFINSLPPGTRITGISFG